MYIKGRKERKGAKNVTQVSSTGEKVSKIA
jgi:hypothetical protein